MRRCWELVYHFLFREARKCGKLKCLGLYRHTSGPCGLSGVLLSLYPEVLKKLIDVTH